MLQAKTVAEQLAAKLNTKLNYQPKEEEEKLEEMETETFRKYEEELEINDFPQQARWRVTSKVSCHLIPLHFFLGKANWRLQFRYSVAAT